MPGPTLSEVGAHYSRRARLEAPAPRGLTEGQARTLTVGDRLVYIPSGATGFVSGVSAQGVSVGWANGDGASYTFAAMRDIRRA